MGIFIFITIQIQFRLLTNTCYICMFIIIFIVYHNIGITVKTEGELGKRNRERERGTLGIGK